MFLDSLPYIPNYSREQIFRCPSLKLLHGANSVIQADVYAVNLENTWFLIKDFSKRPLFMRRLFCRFVLRREYSVLKELQEIAGVPRLFGYLDQDAFIQEYIQGPGELKSAKCTPPQDMPSPGFFARLKQTIAAMHRHGIAHGDLRRKNILQGSQGDPYIIDFATACHRSGSQINLLKRFLFHSLRKSDTLAALKLQRSFHPDSLTPDEIRQLDDLPWPLRLGRFYRKKIYKRIKPKRWRQRSSSKTSPPGCKPSAQAAPSGSSIRRSGPKT